MTMYWYLHSVLSSLFWGQEHDELKKKKEERKKKSWLGLQVQFVAPKQGKAKPCPWPGLYVTNKLSLANKPEYKNPSQKQKMGICIPQTMPKARIWAIYSWKSKFRKSIWWATFANLTDFSFFFSFSEMKRTKTSLIGDPNCVPGRNTSNLQFQSWCNL